MKVKLCLSVRVMGPSEVALARGRARLAARAPHHSRGGHHVGMRAHTVCARPHWVAIRPTGGRTRGSRTRTVVMRPTTRCARAPPLCAPTATPPTHTARYLLGNISHLPCGTACVENVCGCCCVTAFCQRLARPTSTSGSRGRRHANEDSDVHRAPDDSESVGAYSAPRG